MPGFAGVTAAVATWGILHVARDEPASASLSDVPTVTVAVQREERRWIDEAFRPVYLAAPIGPIPCPRRVERVPPWYRLVVASALEGSRSKSNDAVLQLSDLNRANSTQPYSWLGVLAIAQILIKEGRHTEAAVIVDRFMRSPTGRNLSVLGAQAEASHSHLLGAIHLHQVWAYMLIGANSADTLLWRALKNPIGLTTIAIDRPEITPLHYLPSWSFVPIRAPGCAEDRRDITSHHLYNNLMVGYMLRDPTGSFSAADKRVEFDRPYQDPPGSNPLFRVLELVRKTGDPSKEGWAWALSNAERILRATEMDGRSRGAALNGLDPWVSINVAQILDSAVAWLPVGDSAATQRADEQIKQLLAGAASRADLVAEMDQRNFQLAFTRLSLIQASRRPPRLPARVRTDALTASEREAASSVHWSIGTRQKSAEWLAAVQGPDSAGLSPALTRSWRSSSRVDLSRSFALAAASASVRIVAAGLAHRSRAVLAPGSPPPEELVQQERRLGWRESLPARVWRSSHNWDIAASVVIGVMGFLLFRPVARQLKRRHALFTSYYQLQAPKRS
jgi:hypothetical protein